MEKKEKKISETNFLISKKTVKKEKKFYLKTLYLEIPFLNNAFLISSLSEIIQPENLMVLQEIKKQKNFNLNSEAYFLLTKLVFFNLFRKKKISRAKILLFYQLKLSLKFPKLYHESKKIQKVFFKFFSSNFRSFFFFFMILSGKNKSNMMKLKMDENNSLPFFFLKGNFMEPFEIIPSYPGETKNQFSELDLRYLELFNHYLYFRNFEKLFLIGFSFLGYFLDSGRIPNKDLLFFSEFLQFHPISDSSTIFDFYLFHYQVHYKRIVEKIQKGSISKGSFFMKASEILFSDPTSFGFLRRTRLIWLKKIQKFDKNEKISLFPNIKRIEKTKNLNHTKSLSLNYPLFASRIFFALMLDISN